MSAVGVAQPPLRVSPLIKLARWSCLFAGIGWGIHKQRKFTRREALLAEKRLAEKPMRDAKLAEEARIAREVEAKLLSDLEKGLL